MVNRFREGPLEEVELNRAPASKKATDARGPRGSTF